MSSAVPDGSGIWTQTAPLKQWKENATTAMMRLLSRYWYDRMAYSTKAFHLAKNMQGAMTILD
jgi:hypothetical protein